VVSGKNSIFLIILVSLITAAAVSAAPTITCSSYTKTVPASNTNIIDLSETYKIAEIYNTFVTAIGSEILNTPAAFTVSQFAGTEIIHPHAAVFIVLIGFLFVSLAIDRRLCLATLTAQLKPTAMRYHFITQFAPKIPGKNIRRKSPPGENRLFHLEDFSRSICDVNSTPYINLLHNLAGIPDDRLFLPNITLCHKNQQEQNTNKVPRLSIITHFSPLLHPALIRMAPRAEQNFSFSPGFIFVRLARGPPKMA
jgi:hypothetical protein